MVSKELKKKKDDEARQIWTGVPPSVKWCRTCLFAEESTEYVNGAEKSSCVMFDEKPDDVFLRGAECVFYTEEE